MAGGNAARLGIGAVPGVTGPRRADVQRRLIDGVGNQVIRVRFGDGHGHHISRPGTHGARGYVEVHESTVGGPAAHSLRVGVFATLAVGDQQLDGAADDGLVLFEGDAVLQSREAFVAFLHDGLGNLVGHGRGGRPGPNGVLERVRGRESRRFHHSQGLLKVFLGLTGKAHDNIRTDCGIGHLSAHALKNAEELRRPIGAAHGFQYLVGTGLQRHVQLRHNRGRLGHGVDNVVGERGGVRTREADALQPGDLAGRAQQLAKCKPITELDAVRVDVLAEEGDLDGAIVDERLDLGKNLPRPAVFLLATQGGHNAEGAGVVAADGNRHPAAVARVAFGGQRRGERLK